MKKTVSIILCCSKYMRALHIIFLQTQHKIWIISSHCKVGDLVKYGIYKNAKELLLYIAFSSSQFYQNLMTKTDWRQKFTPKPSQHTWSQTQLPSSFAAISSIMNENSEVPVGT